MNGVQDLRARIEALSFRITVQTELLRSLEREKSLAQRQLNAVLDPVARLPIEIASEIFLHSLPFIPERPSIDYIPMLLLDVCTAWNNIALSIPQLWATICVVCPCAVGFEKGFQTWVQRAGSQPLSIHICGRLRDDGAASLIWAHAGRFKHLEICDDEEFFDPSETIDLLGGTSPGGLPSLETMTIRGSGLGQEEFCGRQILQLLHLAPGLIECTFEDVGPVSEDEIEKVAPPLVLRALRRMMFGARPEIGRSDDNILKYLTLPALQTLRLPLNAITSDDLLSLLKRSSPPLKELILGDGSPSDSARLDECLDLVPTLEGFEIWRIKSDLLNELLTALTRSSSLVPNLTDLRIFNLRESDDNPDLYWGTLLRVLSSRPKLQTVHITISEYKGLAEPSADILAVFRDLAQRGQQIHISYNAGNLVDAKKDSSDEERDEEDVKEDSNLVEDDEDVV
ncbi:hypothetical protein C8R47DRAFT_1153508 [Mycena vitilis]|nr:hypothetical protein C8R47DRAFT_1153508 [Mycena vitilis]